MTSSGKLLLTLCESENKSVPSHRNVESGSAIFTVLSNFTTERFKPVLRILFFTTFDLYCSKRVTHVCTQEAAKRSCYGL